MDRKISADEHIIEKSVQLSLIEVLIGSALHTLRIPFSGHFLSLNQGLLLSKFTEASKNRYEAFRAVIEISLVTSSMKALAPSGRKLGPMMSISMQGLLYGVGILLGGLNPFGRITGMILLSLWAFLQPMVSYFLIYGPDLVKAFTYLLSKIKKYTGVEENLLLTALLIAVFIKVVLAISVPFLVNILNRRGWNQYETFFRKKAKGSILLKGFREENPSALKGTLKDISSPAFIISLLIMFSFFFITETSHVKVAWKVLRSLSIAFLLFYLVRAEWFQEVLKKLALRSSFFNRIYILSKESLDRMLVLLGKK